MSIPIGNRILAYGVLASVLFYGPVRAEPADASSADPAPAGGPASQPAAASPDDFLMNSGSMVNDFTGQPSFSLNLGRVTGGNALNFAANLQYFGGVEEQDRTNVQFQAGSWVGLGFSLKWPQITADNKGTAAIDDDDYFLSLDGQPIRLVGNTSNAKVFNPKNNRAISVTRFVSTAGSQTINDPYVPPYPDNSAPIYPVTFSVPYVSGWRVDLPGGESVYFDFTGNCDNDNAVMCTPTTLDNLGYQPFFNYSSGARIPDQWNVTRIRDRDAKFSIFFEYDKIREAVVGNQYAGNNLPARPQVTADRAVYLKRVYSVNGTTATSELISEMTLVRKAKPVADYFESAWGLPLARFQKECVDYINLANLGKNVRKYIFQYGQTANSKLRLERIDEVEPTFSKSRVLHQFTYDPADTWKLTKVVDQKGIETEFEWTQFAGLKFSNAFDLTRYFSSVPYTDRAGFAGTTIKTRLEYGNSFFFSVEAESCTDPGDVRRDKLFQFRNNGGFWELAHVFVAPKANCEGEFFLAPDASYILHVSSAGSNSDVTVYNLPPTEDFSQHVDGVPQVVDLATTPLLVKTLFAGLPVPVTRYKKSVFVFRKWFAISHPGDNKIRFFYKGDGGAWRNGTQDPAGNPINCIVSQNSYSGLTESRTNCLDFAYTTLDVRAGSDFLAVLNKFGNSPRRSVLHVFGYNGGIKEYLKGLRMSKAQKNLSGWAYDSDWEIWQSGSAGVDYYNVWDYEIKDWSVSGNLILINSMNYLQSNYSTLHAFGWDGNQLRFLHRENNVAPTTIFYAGPDYYVKQDMSSFTGPTAYFYLVKFDLKRWAAVNAGSHFATKSFAGDEWWTAKCMPGFVFLERMASTKVSSAYEPAIIGRDADYPHKNQNGLFFLHGADGSSISEASTTVPTQVGNHTLGNVQIQQDRLLGVAVPPSGTVEAGHFFGKLRPGAPGNPPAQSSPSWTLNQFPEEGFWESKSAQLLSSGVVMFRHALNGSTQQFNGDVQFFSEQAGVLARSVAPSHPWVVSKVHVRTRGSQSGYWDGTLKTLAFSYQNGGDAHGAAFNNLSKVPNFKVVRKTRQVYGDNKGVVQSTFRMDLPNNRLTAPQKALHGSVETMSFEPAGSPNKPGAWTRTSRNVSDRVATTPNGIYPLKESLFQLRNQGGEHRTYFDARYMESRQDFTRVDTYTGLPTVTVARQGSAFSVRIVRYEHEYTGARPFSLARQTADFLFTSDPCTVANGEYCGNITPEWLMTSPQNTRAVASQIYKYSTAGLLTESWQWRPATAGTPLPTLDGNTGLGTWHRASTVLEWQRDNAAARSKHLGPTLAKVNGLNILSFYGGIEGRQLGVIHNATRSTATLLTGEEASVTANRFGAFGEWENGGASLSQDVVHSGRYSFKATQIYGPTVNINYWSNGSSFWDKKKGFLVSAWIFVDGTRGSSATDPYPAFAVEFRTAQNAHIHSIDLIAEYPAANLPYNKWVKLERHVTWSELNTWIPGSDSYLRIWAGKASSANARPVYVDDFRIHPVDASATSQVFNELGQVTASLDGNNEPTFYQYDAWGQLLGSKNARGLGYSATGGKAFSE